MSEKKPRRSRARGTGSPVVRMASGSAMRDAHDSLTRVKLHDRPEPPALGDDGLAQLLLPLPGIHEHPPTALTIPRADRVFANRNLRMGGIDWIGFDMDYTL